MEKILWGKHITSMRISRRLTNNKLSLETLIIIKWVNQSWIIKRYQEPKILMNLLILQINLVISSKKNSRLFRNNIKIKKLDLILIWKKA
jgi:hypothetical protein